MYEEAKKAAAEKAVEEVRPGMTVGLGTGTTAYYAIEALGRRMQEGYGLQAVASSVRSEELAASFGLPIVAFSSSMKIDVYLDGADEVDEQGNLIKGGGGALVREKILASNSAAFIVMVDESKLVKRLGKFPLPVEIVPFAWELTVRRLEGLGCRAKLRRKGDEPFRSDNGNFIADCVFDMGIAAPAQLNATIDVIPGVVESGLFGQELVHRIISGDAGGAVRLLR